jgi:pyruvate dehydrogenase E2 component (dihydrolipoamide acetyltransferase)
MEMEAFDDGVITEIQVPEGGEKAPIGGVLAILNGDSAAAAEATPVAAPAAQATPIPAQAAPLPRHSGARRGRSRSSDDTRIKASPLARKVSAEARRGPLPIAGSGPGGRIVREDVEAVAKSGAPRLLRLPPPKQTAAAALPPRPRPAVAASTPLHPSAAASTPAAILPTAKEGDEIIQLSSMRKIIASRLLTSKVTIPHFYLHLEVDAAPALALRKQVNDQAEKTHGNKYSVNDFILKAVINATVAVPAINASFAGDHIVKFKHVGLSVAIAVEDGLVTPVIKEAESKILLAISRGEGLRRPRQGQKTQARRIRRRHHHRLQPRCLGHRILRRHRQSPPGRHPLGRRGRSKNPSSRTARSSPACA